MAASSIEKAPITIYLVGVPASGKTTLLGAFARRLHHNRPQARLIVISEVARELVLRNKVHPSDIQSGQEVAMELQKRILETQMMREEHAGNVADLILSDRSGVDPIAFATKYGGIAHGQILLSSNSWTYLRERMQRGLVVLCEPVPQWFVQDGVRIVPACANEMDELHQIFCDILLAEKVPFTILSASLVDIQQRVECILDGLRDLEQPPL